MINREVVATIMDALAATADTKGTGYALPPTPAGNRVLTWQSSFSVAPDAINITLEGAIEDTDAKYATLDTTTAVGGELRTVTTASAIRFIRAHQNSKTGAVTTTVKVSVS